ncbi:1-phosphofructokinase family hexose kinase [Flexivirga sp. B27]
MIVAVCLNPALDVTYDVPGFEVGAAQRVRHVRRRAGGKGVNVASVLHAQGTSALTAGPIGGAVGAEIVDDLRERDVPAELTHIAGSSRQTVTVVSDDDATVLNEPGPVLTEAEWSAFTKSFARLMRGTAVVTMSGSLPGGVPTSAYAELTRIAHDHGASVIVDCEGEPLVRALHAAPDIVKINEHEAAATTLVETATGSDSLESVLAAAEELHSLGAREVVITRGAAGLAAHTVQSRFAATAAGTVAGNPTGAGDAFTAGLADAVAAGLSWPDRLRRAAGWAAGAVARPTAGDLDPTIAADHESRTIIRELSS